MTIKERKYKGTLSLGGLEIACEAEEESYGHIVKLEAVGGLTVATYDSASFPALNSLALMPKIEGLALPPSEHAAPLFDGAATVLGAAIKVSLFRKK